MKLNPLQTLYSHRILQCNSVSSDETAAATRSYRQGSLPKEEVWEWEPDSRGFRISYSICGGQGNSLVTRKNYEIRRENNALRNLSMLFCCLKL